MSKPKFSILMAAHNSGRFVEKAIQSVVLQKFTDWEMVVVCDAPIDGTSETVQRLAAMDSRIRCKILPRNVGVGAAYSIALSKARGEICGILDADDCLPPEAMTTIVKFYDALPDVGFIWTMHNWYNETMSKVRRGISNPPSAGTIYASEDGFKHVYSHWRTFRTKFRDQAVLFDPDLKCTVDKNLGYVLEQLTPGAFLPIRLYNYRYHRRNLSHKTPQKEVWRKLRKKYKDAKRFKSIILHPDVRRVSPQLPQDGEGAI
jgi:glycosyltransferase involved in cell wall biosynthesis